MSRAPRVCGALAAVATVAAAAGAVGAPARRLAGGHAARAAPRVQMMVVGRTRTLLDARQVTARTARILASGRRCSVPAATALSTLVQSRLSLRVTNVSGCAPPSMFVIQVGHERNAGSAGWEYKIGRRAPSSGAADPAGRLRSGTVLLWFYCLHASACQRTLGVKPAARTVPRGAPLRALVTAYDDNGRGRAIAGATVKFGSLSAVTGADGAATVSASLPPGRYRIYATKAGLVRSFPSAVRVT